MNRSHPSRRHGAMLSSIPALPERALIGAIRAYQRFISPVVPVVTLGQCGCRFTPTCSHYAAEAIQTHGAIVGLWLAVRRLLKCTPLHPGGHDPVPPKQARRCTPVRRADANPPLPFASDAHP